MSILSTNLFFLNVYAVVSNKFNCFAPTDHPLSNGGLGAAKKGYNLILFLLILLVSYRIFYFYLLPLQYVP